MKRTVLLVTVFLVFAAVGVIAATDGHVIRLFSRGVEISALNTWYGIDRGVEFTDTVPHAQSPYGYFGLYGQSQPGDPHTRITMLSAHSYPPMPGGRATGIITISATGYSADGNVSQAGMTATAEGERNSLLDLYTENGRLLIGQGGLTAIGEMRVSGSANVSGILRATEDVMTGDVSVRDLQLQITALAQEVSRLRLLLEGGGKVKVR